MQVGRCIGAGAAYFPKPASENLEDEIRKAWCYGCTERRTSSHARIGFLINNKDWFHPS